MMKVVFAGERGAFAEIAARGHFGGGVELSSVRDFEDVFTAVRLRRADFGVVPIENSLAGSIHQNYDNLLESKLYITAEIYLRVNHFLVGKKGTDLSAVRRVFSHPQALSQCKKFLKRRPKIEQIPVTNTALAAKMVSEDGKSDTAAIASIQAVADYGMEVLMPNIEDRSDNVTRFLVLSRAPSEKGGAEERKTSLVFSLQNVPGVLFKALGVFALRDIDLFKIESRPIRGKGFDYLFYLDCRGDITDTALKNAVSHLREIAAFYRLLGSYDIGAVKLSP